MTIGKRENRFISHLLRYSFWTFGIAGAFGATVLIGASLRAYNNEPSYDLPCVWDYDADSTLEMPYRYDPINNDYRSAFQYGIAEYNDADTPAEFAYITSQISHRLGVQDRPESEC